MSKCKKCGAEVKWIPKPGGPDAGFLPPQNPDGSRHTCGDNVSTKQSPQPPAKTGNENPTTTIIGRLDAYENTSATFMGKDGKSHTYAITTDRSREWDGKKYPRVADSMAPVFLKVTLDKVKFIQAAEPVDAPDWQYDVPKPGSIKPALTQEDKLKAAGFEVPAEKSPGTNATGPEATNALPNNHVPDHPPKTKETPDSDPFSMPTHDELVRMVYDSTSYWKAKTFMDIATANRITKQVEFKNRCESYALAIKHLEATAGNEGERMEANVKGAFVIADQIYTEIMKRVNKE